LAAINLRNQMQEIRRNITQELGRIRQGYQSDYDIALARESSLKNSLASVVSETQLTNQAQVQLRELESNSQTFRAMYDSFLQRYMEAIQQQSFPITEARLISPAARPLGKSHPKSAMVLALAFGGGLVLSFGAAFLREINDRVFRTMAQVEDALQTNCLAVVPLLKGGTEGLADITSVRPSATSQTTAGAVTPVNSVMRHVVEHPFSRFAEALRSIKVAADINGMVRRNNVIGVTSSMPGEGKSTIASNLAQLIAHAGGRVLLIDGDLRNPSITRALGLPSRGGLVDVIAGDVVLDEALVADPATGLMFLGSGTSSRLLHTNEILSSGAMKKLVDDVRSRFDYVVIDFPPLAPVVDVRATTAIVDAYLFVIEWGRTKIDAVEHALSTARGVHDRLLGTVLNKADPDVIGRYEHYHGSYYYKKHYARYGYGE
jgi:succinoglycan biosynthesis transport protein ExoP